MTYDVLEIAEINDILIFVFVPFLSQTRPCHPLRFSDIGAAEDLPETYAWAPRAGW